MDAVTLNSQLTIFYVEVRQENGEKYKKSSLIAIRHDLNRSHVLLILPSRESELSKMGSRFILCLFDFPIRLWNCSDCFILDN